MDTNSGTTMTGKTMTGKTMTGKTMTGSFRPRLVTLVAAAGLAAAGSLGVATSASAVSQADAESQFNAAGISWTSSGGCTTRSNPTCTSFDGLRQASIDGAKTLKSASGCGLLITGATEVGHADGTYSHYNGYKLDFSRSTCLTNWVQSTYTPIGGNKYESASGNIYYDEGNHWDVTFYTCGC